MPTARNAKIAGMTLILDRRLTPARPDLAASHLRGQVEARAFVEPEPRRVIAPVAPLRREPRPDAPLDTEALRGEAVQVYERFEGWAWVQLGLDGYVGYLPDYGPAAGSAGADASRQRLAHLHLSRPRR